MGGRLGLLCLLTLGGATLGVNAWASPREELAETSYVIKPTKLWTEPGQFGEPVALLQPGLKFEIIVYSTSQDWVQIATPAGREGWVPVRFTALSGRRSSDILIGNPNRGNEEDARDPASVLEDKAEAKGDKAAPNDKIATTLDAVPVQGSLDDPENLSPPAPEVKKPAPKKARAKKPVVKKELPQWEVSGSVEFSEMLTPDTFAGFALRPNVFYRINQNFLVGGGLDYLYHAKTTTGVNSLGSTIGTVSEDINEIFVNAGARYEQDHFRIDGVIGLSFQRNDFSTVDANGNPVSSTPDGLATGTEWGTGYAFRISPSYLFPVGENMDIGVTASYMVRMNGSTSAAGSFAGVPGSRFENSLGLGVNFAAGF